MNPLTHALWASTRNANPLAIEKVGATYATAMARPPAPASG
jgi:hypothetical protein